MSFNLVRGVAYVLSLFRMYESFNIRGGEEWLGVIGDRKSGKGSGDKGRGVEGEKIEGGGEGEGYNSIGRASAQRLGGLLLEGGRFRGGNLRLWRLGAKSVWGESAVVSLEHEEELRSNTAWRLPGRTWTFW